MAALQISVRRFISVKSGCSVWVPCPQALARCLSSWDTAKENVGTLHDTDTGDELSDMAKDLNLSKLELAEKILRQSIKESEGELGSGIGGANMDRYVCANWSASEGLACSHAGLIPCGLCGLVSYCSSECRTENLGEHRDCCHLASAHKTGSSAGWKQRMVKSSEGKRAFLRIGPDFVWGNMPAYGILPQSLQAAGMPLNFSLCFCASGDLRNVIETVCQLPNKFGGQVTIYINDRNPTVMARNFLMLKLLQTYGFDALDVVIAVWYSAAMTHSQSIIVDGVVIHTLKSTVGLGFNVDEELHADFPAPSGSSLHVSNGFKLWPVLAHMSGIKSSMQELWSSRMEKLKSGLKSQCKTSCLLPSHQVALKAFHERGVLLPFGAYHAHHSAPNKFLFHPSSGWLPHADVNPFSGWDITSVLAMGSHEGLPESDLFGSLFFYVRGKLLTFLQKLHTCKIHFNLSCKEASELAEELALKDVHLHCIDTSNLADREYGGLARVLHDWGPLLDRASEFTPTLITYFMNWLFNTGISPAHEALTLSKLTRTDVYAAVALMNAKGSPSAEKLKALLALENDNGNISILNYFHDFTTFFEEYLQSIHAGADARRVGLFRRKKHLVIPHRLFVNIDDSDGIPGKTASYNQCYHDCVIGDSTFTERFVEWGPYYI